MLVLITRTFEFSSLSASDTRTIRVNTNDYGKSVCWACIADHSENEQTLEEERKRERSFDSVDYYCFAEVSRGVYCFESRIPVPCMFPISLRYCRARLSF